MAIYEGHVKQRAGFADGVAQQRAGGRVTDIDVGGIGHADTGTHVGQRQRDNYLADLLNQLAERRWGHVLLPLHKAAEGAHSAYDGQRGRDGYKTGARFRVPYALAQKGVKHDH